MEEIKSRECETGKSQYTCSFTRFAEDVGVAASVNNITIRYDLLNNKIISGDRMVNEAKHFTRWQAQPFIN